MAQPELRQRLASILAADVAGYSRLMSLDERATVAALEASRAVFRAAIEAHHGRVIDMVGDAVLALFDSATGAVAAAIAIQEVLHRAETDTAEIRRMRFRIGVHLGDVFEKSDGSIYGDGVNLAARLEALADAGGIAVSGAVEGAVRGKIALPLEHLGTQQVKNISTPVDVYRIALPWQATPPAAGAGSCRLPILALAAVALILGAFGGFLWLHGVPRWSGGGTQDAQAQPPARSVAVLPFADLSESRNQSYFSDGLSEEVIGRLAQIPQLRVIARTSSFSFKDSPASAADIAGRLHVATLLEGSVRREADRVRITAKLIRASDGTFLWSGTYERRLTDVFAIQEEIASAVVTALKVNLDQSSAPEQNRYQPKAEAYDAYLLGRQLMRTRAENYEQRAVQAFSTAVEIDHGYAAAYSMLAFVLSFVAENDLDPVRRRVLADRALAAADTAVGMGPTEPDAFATRGFLRFEFRWDRAGADRDFREAMRLDPNAGPTLTKYAYYLAAVGQGDTALALARKIKATDPFFAPPWELEGQIQAARGDYASAEDSIRHARSILQLEPETGRSMAILALLKGEPERARAMFANMPDAANRDWGLALAEHDLGHPDAAARALQAFVAESPFEYYRHAVVCSRIGNRDAAFAALDRAYETNDPALQAIMIDPLLADLRTDARYEALLARMGLTGSDPRALRAS